MKNFIMENKLASAAGALASMYFVPTPILVVGGVLAGIHWYSNK